jgi:drug/metabolite transporter (DMT)-like permease
MLKYVLAVLAACANATSSVLQRKANRQTPQRENLSLKLIWSLAHKPVWFGGILAITAGFLLQATALGNGQLSVVEPILVLELPATLILASRIFGTRLHRREWGSAATMTAGLAGLLYFLSPSAGRTEEVRWYTWLTAIGVNLAFVAVLVAWGRRGPAGRGRKGDESSALQAAVLAVAAGSTFGLTAALMKGMTNTYAQGFGVLFTSWQLYGMIAAGVLGMFLVQSALNAGRLIAAQPGLTLSDPVVSILWGVLVFHEQVRGGWFIAPAVVSGVAMAAAVVTLARSPLLSGQTAQPGEERPGQGRKNLGKADSRRHSYDGAPDHDSNGGSQDGGLRAVNQLHRRRMDRRDRGRESGHGTRPAQARATAPPDRAGDQVHR